MQNKYRRKGKYMIYGMLVLIFLLSVSGKGYMVMADEVGEQAAKGMADEVGDQTTESMADEAKDLTAEKMADGAPDLTGAGTLTYTATSSTGIVVNADGASVIYFREKAVIEYEIETDDVYTELHSRVEAKEHSAEEDGILKKDALVALTEGEDAAHKIASECFEIGKDNFAEGAYTLTYWLQDASGEHKLTEKTVDFIFDQTSPVISGVVYSDQNGILEEKYHNIYSSQSIRVEFSVKDQGTGVNEQRVYVTVEKPGKNDARMYIAHKAAGDIYYVYVPTDLSVTEFNGQITIWANDRLNNESCCRSANLVYQTGKPSVRMDCDTDYTKWTNQDVSFDTSVSDEKCGLKEIVYKINHKTVKKVTFQELTTSYSYELIAGESADKATGYTVSVEVTNNCGTTNTAARRVYIDKEPPVVTLSGVQNGQHYNTDPVVMTNVRDVSYQETKTVYKITRVLDGKEYPVSAAAFYSGEYEDSCSRKMVKEGKYQIYAVTTDAAGNKSISDTLEFVVDKTSPEIHITGTENYEQWKEPVTVQFTVEESYYAQNSVRITGTRTDMDGKVTEVAVPDFISGGKVSRLTQLFDRDGTYEFEVAAKDAAGNRNSKKIHFTIDRTTPEIHNVKQYDGGYYRQFQVGDSLAEVFRDLTVVSYRILLNGVEYDGTTLIKEEGKYTLDIEVTDELGNPAHQIVEFIIDRTAPKVIFSGVKDGETVYDSGTITVAVENPEDKITDVRMNGLHYGADVSSLPYTEYGAYQIEVDCVDKAGNSATGSLHFVYSNPVTDVVIFGGMGILAVLACIWIWLGTGKEKQEGRRRDKSSSV
ncbi:MAG: Ig-like domain-containing protein [Clostridium sp.]|nr:Ig-like domain-containing protein [Clostridium sp.]